jgi:hypothetical protein
MSDSIIVRVTLNSYDVVHPSEQQTQVYVQIPEVARASWLLDADFYRVMKGEPWPHVVDSAREEYERRGTVSDSASAAARAAVVEWLAEDANHDAMQAAWFMEEARRHPVARTLLRDKERLTTQVAELEAAAYGDAKVRLLTPVEQIRHLHAAVAAQLARAGTLDRLLREAQARVAELEAALPSRFTATPAEVDAYLRTVLAENTYLRFQQEIGAQALGEVVEDAQKVRASADNDGLYNADWREGWDDAIERVDPDLCGPAPSTLVAFADEPQADGITRRIAPVQALREDEPAMGGREEWCTGCNTDHAPDECGYRPKAGDA